MISTARTSWLGVTCAALALLLAAAARGQAPTSPRPAGDPLKRLPGRLADGADLPNGWRITPAGKAIASMGDLVTNMAVSPDGKVMAAVNSGFLPHGVDLFDVATRRRIQHIDLPSAWVGLAWSPDGRRLFVSGGNASGEKNLGKPDAAAGQGAAWAREIAGGDRIKPDPVAPVHEFAYAGGRLTPAGRFVETINPKQVWWSGVAYLPARRRLYAVNRGTGRVPSNVVVFDADARKILTRIPVDITPYQALLSADGKRLFVSNLSSDSVSVIDTDSDKVVRTLPVGRNPNDIKLSADGRLFVACSNDNTVRVIDTRTLQLVEQISTTLTPLAPEGSTPNALAIDDRRHLLYVANADNNSVAVVNIGNRVHSAVAGFIPTGWYPSALALADRGGTLFIAAAKGEEGHPDPRGPHSPLTEQDGPYSQGGAASAASPDPTGIFSVGKGNVHTLQTSSVEALSVKDLRDRLALWTRQVAENTPYNDSLLSEARPPREPSVIPASVGEPSPIRHVIYIIKENRTYDQVLGDLPGNGDPRLTLFGEQVTPNQHALARQYVTLDNLYADGEVSADGHFWSTAAYATDFYEKQWPALYGGISKADYFTRAATPSGGFLWDLARVKGLTYLTYEEGIVAVGKGGKGPLVPRPGMEGLYGHIAQDYFGDLEVKDSEKVKVFLRDLGRYEANFEDADPAKRLPNLTIVRMMEDHTMGAKPGERTPRAMVADNDWAIGQLVEAVSHGRYWPQTAIFIIEDDAQDGSDHVDARRTVGLVVSPYVKRGVVDSTLYSTSSMVRSMELLLGLPPMSQYDAAAMPMYAAFGVAPTVTPFSVVKPGIDLDEMNAPGAFGAKASARMDFSEPDRAPMHLLNQVIWKSVKGKDSVMPPPVHRFRPIIDADEAGDRDGRD